MNKLNLKIYVNPDPDFKRTPPSGKLRLAVDNGVANKEASTGLQEDFDFFLDSFFAKVAEQKKAEAERLAICASAR